MEEHGGATVKKWEHDRYAFCIIKYFILNRTTKMRVSSIKQHVWDDFKNKIPSLGEIKLTNLKSIKCPI